MKILQTQSRWRRIVSALLAVVLAMVSAVTLQPTTAYAANHSASLDINAGVDFTKIYDTDNRIYFGTYNHQIAVPAIDGNALTTTDYEGKETPILWQVMGEEASENLVTLMSTYAIDSKPYHTAGNTSTDWKDSNLRTWLNNDFKTNSFTETEKSYIKNTSVETRFYNGGSFQLSDLFTGSNSTDAFYLPWGTPPPNIVQLSDKNSLVWWSATPGADKFPAEGRLIHNALAGNSKNAELKGYQAVNSWLRNRNDETYFRDEYALYVPAESDTVNNGDKSFTYGVRPIFKLDPAKILFASEIVPANGLERHGQTPAYSDSDGTIYYEENKDTPLDATSYKLTLQNDNITLNSLVYEGQQLKTTPGDSVPVLLAEPGDTLSLTAEIAGGNNLAYKIVRYDEVVAFGKSNPGRESAGNESDKTSIDIVAKDLLLSNQGNLDEGRYEVYVWAEKSNDNTSHEGSMPVFFQLLIQDDATPPKLETVSSVRIGQATAEVTFKLTGDSSESEWTYYYQIEDLAATPPTATEVVAGNSPHRLLSASTEVTHTIAIDTLPDTAAKVLYLVAKDEAGNVSKVLVNPIGDYASANLPPVAKSIIPTQQVVSMATTSFVAGDIAEDPNGDAMSVVSASVTNTALANVSVSGDRVSVGGLIPGNTTIDVIVSDGSLTSGTIQVPLEVLDIPEQPTVVPNSLTMVEGESRTLQVEMGLGQSGALDATLISNDTTIATVTPGTLLASGPATVTAVAPGTTSIQVVWDNGVQETVVVQITAKPVNHYIISYTAHPGGTVTGSIPSGTAVSTGTTVTLTAAAQTGYTFSGWLVDGVAAGNNQSLQVTVVRDTSVVAKFTKETGGTDPGGTDPEKPGGDKPGGDKPGGSTGDSGSRPYTGGGGGGGGGGAASDTTKSAIRPATTKPFVVDRPVATNALHKKTQSNVGYAQVAYSGIIRVLPEAFETFSEVPVRFDTTEGRIVLVRVTLLEPSKMTEEMYLSGHLTGKSVTKVERLFGKWFKNTIQVIHFDQEVGWDQTVEIAAKVDVKGMDVDNLVFYSYNQAKNEYRQIKQPNYWIDANGYLRFESDLAGDIVVSEGPLQK